MYLSSKFISINRKHAGPMRRTLSICLRVVSRETTRKLTELLSRRRNPVIRHVSKSPANYVAGDIS